MIRVLVLVAALMSFSARPAHADPVSTAIITGLSITSIVGQALVRILVGFAVSALTQALTRPDQPKARNPGIKTQSATAGDQTPQSFILGHYGTAGNLAAPMMSHGSSGDTPNAYLTQVLDLGDMPITALTDIWIDGDYFPIETDSVWTGTVNADYGVTPGSGPKPNHNGKLFYRFHDGSQTVADSGLIAKYASYPERPWLTTMIGRGVPYAILTYKYKPEVYQAIPKAMFAARGIALYDPRKDSTAGGSGSHRWANQATWEYSDNPVVMIYNILRGITLPDGETYGLGVSEDRLPAAVWFGAMADCDDLVDGSPRYRAGYEAIMATAEDGGETPMDVIDELLKACSGALADVGGSWRIRVGAPAIAVEAITDDDIIISQPQDLDPYPAITDLVNALKAQYPEPAENWQVKDAPTRYDLAAEAEDGERLVKSITLPAVPYGDQVQRLMDAWLKDSRRMRRHTITLPPEYSTLEPLQTIAWSSERNGYVDKLFEIGTVALDATLHPTLSLREVDPADYDWEPEFALPVSTPSRVKVTPAGDTLPGWSVSAVTLPDATGTGRRVAPKLSWTPGLTGIRSVEYAVREKVSATVVAASTTTAVETGFVIVPGEWISGVIYQARARGLERDTEWTSWTDVLMPTVDGIVEADLAGLITAASFAATITPPGIGFSLPALPSEYSLFFLRTDGKLYRNDGSTWTPAVPTTDLTGELQSHQYADDSIVAGKMAAAAISGREIAGDSILGHHFHVANFANLFLDSLHDDESYLTAASGSLIYATTTVPDLFGTSRVVRLNSGSAGAAAVAVTPVFRIAADGEDLHYRLRGRIDSGLSGSLTLQLQVSADDTFSSITTLTSAAVTENTPTLKSGTFIAPSGKTYARFRLVKSTAGTAVQASVGEVLVRRKNGGELIVDGSIQTPHLAAGAVDAGKIQTGTLIRNLFASGVLQVPFLPIDIRLHQSTSLGVTPAHSGMAMIFVLGAGGSGAAVSTDGGREAAASGAAAGAFAMMFVPDIAALGAYDVVIGAGGAGKTASGTGDSKDGSDGGTTSFTSGAISMTCTGGEGGNGGNSGGGGSWGDADGAVGGSVTLSAAALSLGAVGYAGGDSSPVATSSNAKDATGGAAPDVGLNASFDGQGTNVRSPGKIMTALQQSLAIPPLPILGAMGDGTAGVISNTPSTSVASAAAPFGSGSGGAATYSGVATSGAGGNGLVAIVYSGAGNLT